MEEIWKDVAGYENIYQISNFGRVKSIDRLANHVNGMRFVSGRILKPNTCQSYLNVSLSKNGKMKRFTIHRLVAVAFISNPNNLPQINHIDGDKLNNNFANLEWCSASDNQKHAYKIKLKKSANLGKFGKEHHLSRAISQYDIYGNLVNKFFSTREANRETLINQGSIAACARGERRTAGGFIWQYEE